MTVKDGNARTINDTGTDISIKIETARNMLGIKLREPEHRLMAIDGPDYLLQMHVMYGYQQHSF